MIAFIIAFISFVSPDISWDAKADFIVADELNYFYLVEGSRVEKRDSLGQMVHFYSAPSLGEVSYLDVSNPLRPFVFYQDLGKIVFLNTMMAPIDPQVDLFELPGLVNQVCNSANQHFWAYDAQSMSASRLDFQLQEIASTGLLRNWVGGEWQVEKMMEYNERLYLWGGKEKLVVFDIFGNYLKEMVLPQADNLWIKDGALFLRMGNKVTITSIDFPLETAELSLALSNTSQMAISPKYFALLDGGKVVLKNRSALKP